MKHFICRILPLTLMLLTVAAGCSYDPHKEVTGKIQNPATGVVAGLASGDIVLLRGEERQIIAVNVFADSVQLSSAEKGPFFAAIVRESGREKGSVLIISLPPRNEPLRNYNFKVKEKCVPKDASIAELAPDGKKFRLTTDSKWISLE